MTKKSEVIEIRYAEEIKFKIRGEEVSLNIPSAKKLAQHYDSTKDESINPIDASIDFIIDCGMDKKLANLLQPMELRAITDVLAGKLKDG